MTSESPVTSGSPVTRGFVGRRRRHDQRLPPGQYDVGDDFPVLTAEVTPRLDLENWTFTVDGLVARPRTWSWAQLQAMPHSTFRGDIHCVTAWSKLDTSFTGVAVDDLLAEVTALPAAHYVLARSYTGYTTNLELADLVDGRAWVVWRYENGPLPVEHGGPARLLVPHRYFWKSAKWISGLRLLERDEPGFWEQNGYHDRGDPWREERYAGD